MSLIDSEYAPFGTVTAGGPDRPDKSSEERERERKADRMKYSAVVRDYFGGDEALFEAAQTRNFPPSVGRSVNAGGWGSSEAIYSKTACDRWKADLIAYVRAIQ